jgi:hypothetical protein
VIYELAPGVLIQTGSSDPSGGKHLLDEAQLEKARDRWSDAKRQTRRLHEEIAQSLGAEAYDPPPPEDAAPSIAVDVSALADVLDDEQLERVTGLPADAVRRIGQEPR